MLGQHPQMYGLPEMHLFCAKTMAEWLYLCSRANATVEADQLDSQHPIIGNHFHVEHGLLRVVALLYFGEQTEIAIARAAEWLKNRSELTTGAVLEQVAQKIHPRVLVDKSPSIVYRLEYLQRALQMFPHARFLHLVRHPRSHGESVMKYLKAMQRLAPVPASHWLFRLASFPCPHGNGNGNHRPELDPQRAWYILNRNICEFLESVPEHNKKRVIGEELLSNPDCGLREIAAWLGLRTDAEALEEMKHPERSPYACFGPPSARYGNDHFFLKRPTLHGNENGIAHLDGPLSWREQGKGLLPEVQQLAREFGYE